MTSVEWDPKAREFLRKLPKHVSSFIFNKVDKEIILNVERYLESLVKREEKKIRCGDYRLFVDYNKNNDYLIIHSIRHRKNAYKR